MDMTLFNVTYLGDGELVGMPLGLMTTLRRWPVGLGVRKMRSVPKTWDARHIELAEYNAEAVRVLVAMARELRAGGPTAGNGRVGGISLVCSSERFDMLSRMFVVNTGKLGERKVLVDGKKVAVRVRDRDSVEAWRVAALRQEAASAITDEYEVWCGPDKLLGCTTGACGGGGGAVRDTSWSGNSNQRGACVGGRFEVADWRNVEQAHYTLGKPELRRLPAPIGAGSAVST
jgi:hypothetical protein